MPKDPTRIPRFEALALPNAEQLKTLATPFEQREALRSAGGRLSPETREAFRPSLAPHPRFSAQRAGVLLATLRRHLADRKTTSRQELEAREGATRRELETLRQELEAREAEASRELEAHRAAAGREIAGLEEQLREAEARAEQFGIPRQRPAPVAAPAPVVSVAPSPTPEPERIAPPAADEEEQDGPQAELTRLFFNEVYGGRPPPKLGYRKLHERMEKWVEEKNRDGGSRIPASLTTIRRVRTKL